MPTFRSWREQQEFLAGLRCGADRLAGSGPHGNLPPYRRDVESGPSVPAPSTDPGASGASTNADPRDAEHRARVQMDSVPPRIAGNAAQPQHGGDTITVGLQPTTKLWVESDDKTKRAAASIARAVWSHGPKMTLARVRDYVSMTDRDDRAMIRLACALAIEAGWITKLAHAGKRMTFGAGPVQPPPSPGPGPPPIVRGAGQTWPPRYPPTA